MTKKVGYTAKRRSSSRKPPLMKGYKFGQRMVFGKSRSRTRKSSYHYGMKRTSNNGCLGVALILIILLIHLIT